MNEDEKPVETEEDLSDFKQANPDPFRKK